MTIDYLLSKIKSKDNVELIKKAYDYANTILDGIKRKNGDSEISHCLEVTNILIDLNVDDATIVSSILHEMLDYDKVIIEDFKTTFGDEIYTIVNSVSKINKLEMADSSENSAIYLRKVMVGLCEDVRVLFIKLADRLHNMRTMSCLSKEHQKEVANETLKVLVPIAHRLGINSIKSELENLCLYYLKPEVYNDILEKLNDTTSKLNVYLNKMKESISKIITSAGINFEIKGRVKSAYSIYNKLNNGKKWENIYDILALRVFVEKESECYAVLGLIHSKYKPMPNRFKDYIAMPKENMYQSLHTTVYGENGRYFEVQIRTYEMDEIAEKGIASHWSYKEKGSKKIQVMMEQKLELYRNIIESATYEKDDIFENVVDSDILSELIYVYTPKGDVVELPKGATPIDFAYRIHSRVGDTMVGAIVNDIMVPIDTPLKENDVVKIMTNASSKPNQDWINVVKTSQAKNKIKAYFSKILKDEYILKGKELLEKELRKRKMSISEVLSSENINKLCEILKFKDLEDIYGSIGSFRYTAGFIINYIVGEDTPTDTLVVKKKVFAKQSNKTDILVDGKENILTHIAKCCHPVKGDEIIGLITKTGGIAIHKSNCINVKDTSNRFVNVSWVDDGNNLYDATIMITISSDKDEIPNILACLVSEKISTSGIDIIQNGVYKIKLRIKNLDEINTAINALSHLKYVKEVKRI